ncbi:MAG: hypothetical protein BroJett018_39140 [Chloroflexota bacterium]|nr:MAG: hypothetical protein BroJett018_39140 [Chloroflexota bacterium]
MSRNPPHKWLIIVSPDAKKSFDRLPPTAKRSFFRHVRELLNADDPYSLPFVEMLKAKEFGRVRRFRIGSYRVFFFIEAVGITHLKHTYKGTLFISEIHDRKEAY